MNSGNSSCIRAMFSLKVWAELRVASPYSKPVLYIYVNQIEVSSQSQIK